MTDTTANQQRRKNIEALFLAAIELPEHEQSRFIQGSTPNEPELRAQVLSLLQADRQSTAVMGGLAQDLNVGSVLQDADQRTLSRVGEQYGSYQLTGLMGSGGMGEVWRAERADGRFDTEVAIKLLRADQMSEAALARFQQEGQLLARLVHPNIARLLDAGISADRRPYLVLELVEGVRIDAYCEQQQLNLNERLLLFCDVLDAIAHAHANLVIHRDLKPANILVTADGVVKLLDFGVATLLDAPEADSGITAAYGPAMTPEYAAPEQLLGATITTATDTFALGLILHVLLAGWHPRRSDDAEPYSLLEAIRHATDELPKASALPTRSALSHKAFNGDIDNIIAKAVAPDALERYPTATALADDLRRYLRHEPVIAQAPTLTYRAAKFVRRHRGGVVSAVLATLALVTAVVVTSLQTLEANRARTQALQEQQQSQATEEFFSLMLEEMNNQPFTPVQLLDRGAAMLNAQYGATQEQMGDVLFALAGRYGALKERDQQRAMLEQSTVIARTSNNNALLAASLCSLATMTLAEDPDSAARYANEGHGVFNAMRAPSIASTVACRRNRARQFELDRDFDQAAEQVQAALTTLEQSQLASSSTRGALLTHLSHIAFSAGNLPRSHELLEKVRTLLADNGRRNTISYLQTINNQSTVLSDMGRLQEAIDLQQAATDSLATSGFATRGAAGFLNGYARTLSRAGRMPEAKALHVRGLQLAQDTGDTYNVAQHHLGLARAALADQDYPAAGAHLDQSEAQFSKNPSARPGEMASVNVLRVQVLRRSGQLQQAKTKVLALLGETGYPNTVGVRGQLSLIIQAAAVHQELGELVQAEALVTDLIARLSESVGNPAASVDVGRAYIHRAEIRAAAGARSLAQADLDRGLPSMRAELGADHREVMAAEALLAQ